MITDIERTGELLLEAKRLGLRVCIESFRDGWNVEIGTGQKNSASLTEAVCSAFVEAVRPQTKGETTC